MGQAEMGLYAGTHGDWTQQVVDYQSILIMNSGRAGPRPGRYTEVYPG